MTTASRPLRSVEVGALVRVRGAWFYVLATHGELILDYAAYDPGYDPSEWDQDPLGGLLQVLPEHGIRFLAALGNRVLPIELVAEMVAVNGGRARPVVVINFDLATLVSSYYDQALETLCGDAWDGRMGDPLDGVPEQIRDLFGSYGGGSAEPSP